MKNQIDYIYLSAIGSDNRDIKLVDDSTEAVVVFENGDTYTASFFTYQHIASLRRLHQQEDDFLNGKYFWVERMVLIDLISYESIQKVIDDLIEQGDFQSVFRKLKTWRNRNTNDL